MCSSEGLLIGLFALFSWGSGGGGTYDDFGIPVADFSVVIFFSFGESSIAGLYACQSHNIIIHRSGHVIANAPP